jgi:hypothetical protein
LVCKLIGGRLDRKIRNRYARVLTLGKIYEYLVAAFHRKLARREDKRQVRSTGIGKLFAPKIAALATNPEVYRSVCGGCPGLKLCEKIRPI